MKLVVAKCPSCGAKIDVDQDSNSTKCDYCGSQVIVEEAIQKYKVEVTGKVEINNLPLLDNYLKIGEMHYNDKEYEEAYKQYSKACDLDPQNYIAILRKGLSKASYSTYNDFDINYAINGMKNAYKIMIEQNLEENEINKYILECNDSICYLEKCIEEYYKKSLLNKEEITELISKLLKCIEAEEYLYSIIETEKDAKRKVVDSIIAMIDYTLKSKVYKTAYEYVKNPAAYGYYLDKNIKNELYEKRKKYVNEKYSLDPMIESGRHEPQKYVDNSGTFAKVMCWLMFGFSALSALGQLSVQPVLSFLWGLTAIIYMPPVKVAILNKNERLEGLILSFRIALPILAFLLGPILIMASLK